MASFKQTLLFFALFVVISVNLSCGPNKIQVMALRDLPVDVAEMKGKLLRLGDISTCGSSCKSRSDCKEGVICSNCVSLGALFSQCM
ncbi:hypothetical protein EJD97_017992 [Solanum chilense]|uniref:Carboxypeptidase A inhibitor-like domain-containing protein n=1 Tax=Solanum chilense TaxID=4083 RepID=A0A6N2AG14_SOLCI|nr:hypothetical protein EJD97_017992 [Solanum chilense]